MPSDLDIGLVNLPGVVDWLQVGPGTVYLLSLTHVRLSSSQSHDLPIMNLTQTRLKSGT